LARKKPALEKATTFLDMQTGLKMGKSLIKEGIKCLHEFIKNNHKMGR